MNPGRQLQRNPLLVNPAWQIPLFEHGLLLQGFCQEKKSKPRYLLLIRVNFKVHEMMLWQIVVNSNINIELLPHTTNVHVQFICLFSKYINLLQVAMYGEEASRNHQAFS